MKKTTLINVFMFTTGAAIGSLVTWKFVKTKYERIAQEEIDSVKEYWARRMIEDVLNDDKPVYDEEDWNDEWSGSDDVATNRVFSDKVVTEYHSIARKYNTSDENEVENGEEGEGDADVPYINGPYVITPQDFADGNYDHDLYSLIYYKDGVLADDWDVVKDIEETIGEESLQHFGDFANEDVVHVRNERLRADYEVVRDPRTYAEVLALNSPTQMNAD